MRYKFNDGGRAAAGYKGTTSDCVVRAVVIATEKPYEIIYRALACGTKHERGQKAKGIETCRNGIYTTHKWFKAYLMAMGWTWHPCMGIGTGCKVHLRDGELPMGRLIVKVSRHFCAVIDGVIMDLHDPQRSGTRCVYGYWIKEKI